MAEGQSLYWRLMPSVRATERDRFLFFFQLSALLTLAQTLGLAGSEALFLERVGPAALPLVFVLAPIATVLGCASYATIVGSVRNDRLFIRLLITAGVALGTGTLLLQLELPGVLHALFCAAYLTQAILINLHFWTFAADFFDTLQSKRLYPYLVVGASAGGALGGTLAALGGLAFPAETLILGWSITLLVAAGVVYRRQSDLQRWRTLGVEEKDESSAAGLQGALRFLNRSPLAGWIAISIIGMISALFVIQYLYMEIFSEAFDSAETLAVFLGTYLALSNLAEIFIGTVVTPLLIKRLGVPGTTLVHALLTLLVFPLLWFYPVLVAAVAARAVRELVENSMAAPVRQLSYNALPFRFRGRVRALLEGVVLFAAMAMVGLALIALGENANLLWLCSLGAGMSLVYLSAGLIVRREYLRGFILELRHGRLDLDIELGQGVLASLAQQWEGLLMDERKYPSQSLLKLAAEFSKHGFGQVVLRASHHPHKKVRITCIEALASFDPTRLIQSLPVALTDKEVDVRLAAVRAAGSLEPRPTQIETRLQSCLRDSDPRVRAQVAQFSGPPGEAVLEALLESKDPTEIVAALECLPAAMSPRAEGLLEHSDQHVRAAALSTSAPHRAEDAPARLGRILDAMADADPEVRQAAARALPNFGSERRIIRCLADALDDSSHAVRDAAARSLALLGEQGVRAALSQLTSLRRWTAEAALEVIDRADDIQSRHHLAGVYRTCVLDAWKLYAGIEIAPIEPTLEAHFLRVALQNAYRNKVWLAFRILAVLEDPSVVKSVKQILDRGSNRDRADALEVLSNLGERETSDQFALLLEAGPFQDKLLNAASFVLAPQDLHEVLDQADLSEDRWLRLAAGPYISLRSSSRSEDDLEQNQQADNPQPDLQSRHEVDLMQRLLALRKVPLFTELSLERLESIHQLMHESNYLAGECVVREGDIGDDLFILLEGELEIYKNHGTPDERLLNTLTPVAYMGEMAILDDSERSATAIASKDSRLLSLGGDTFKEIVLQTPEISFEIFKVLTARIRAAEMRRE